MFDGLANSLFLICLGISALRATYGDRARVVRVHKLTLGTFAATRDLLKSGVSQVLEQLPDLSGHGAD